MHLKQSLTRLVSRFRYPVSLPEDLATDLGLHLVNSLSFQDFITSLASPQARSTTLRRGMGRSQAESVFHSALRREVFPSCSLFSYYFGKGWLVVSLYYDEGGHLRRAHIQCPQRACLDGFDLPLEEEIHLATASSQ